jgi:hypothetical protein
MNLTSGIVRPPVIVHHRHDAGFNLRSEAGRTCAILVVKVAIRSGGRALPMKANALEVGVEVALPQMVQAAFS